MLIAGRVYSASIANQQTKTNIENIQNEITKEIGKTYPENPFPTGSTTPTIKTQSTPYYVRNSGTECNLWMDQAGITDKVNAIILINRESGCNPFAKNVSSGAYGIPQSLPASKMASEGADYLTNPVTQLRWMQKYVTSRYGTWENAVAFSTRNGWY